MVILGGWVFLEREVSMYPVSALFWLTGYSQVVMLGVRYKFVNFRAGKSLGVPDWCA